ARARARARECYAELSGNPRVGVRHVDDGALVPRSDDAESTVPLKRVVERDIVNADDAEDRVDTDAFEFFKQRVRDCDFCAHVLVSPRRYTVQELSNDFVKYSRLLDVTQMPGIRNNP